MIGIIGAMSVEIEKIKSVIDNKTEETFSGVTFAKGTIHGKDVVVAVCGCVGGGGGKKRDAAELFGGRVTLFVVVVVVLMCCNIPCCEC